MDPRIPVLLDTDIGSDIDDAVALAYLLRQPRCELVGVTTVTGDTAQRAACAEFICREAGQPQIPIHCGASRPLLWGPGQAEVPQYRALRDVPHRKDWPKNTAVEFLRETIRSRPGEITLLTIGPYTNAALLFALDPEIPSLLKGLVSMAGVFFELQKEIPNEWNCRVDPVATKMVYDAPGVKDHLSVGLDVTFKCKLTPEEVRRRFVKKPLDAVLKLAEVWFKGAKEMTFHDPLAAALIFHPSLCATRRGRVDASADMDPAKGGMTLFTEGEGPHSAAETVDSVAFFEEYFSVF